MFLSRPCSGSAFEGPRGHHCTMHVTKQCHSSSMHHFSEAAALNFGTPASCTIVDLSCTEIGLSSANVCVCCVQTSVRPQCTVCTSDVPFKNRRRCGTCFKSLLEHSMAVLHCKTATICTFSSFYVGEDSMQKHLYAVCAGEGHRGWRIQVFRPL